MKEIFLALIMMGLIGCESLEKEIATFEANLWVGNPDKVNPDGTKGAITRTEVDELGEYKRHLPTQAVEFGGYLCVERGDFEAWALRMTNSCTCTFPKE